MVGSSSKSVPAAIYGSIATPEVKRIVSEAGIDPALAESATTLELAAAELAAAAGQLVAVERTLLQSAGEGAAAGPLETLTNDREEATAVLERKMAAMQALMASRKNVGVKPMEKDTSGEGGEYLFAKGGATSTGPAAGSGEEIILQGFNWESYREDWYNKLRGQINEWVADGISAVWLPPCSDAVSSQGYLPRDLWNLNSKYGDEGELRALLREMREQRIISIADIVINHRCATFQDDNGIWNRFGGRMQWDHTHICSNNPQYAGAGAFKKEEDYTAAPNVDHTQERVRKDIVLWLNHLRKVGFDGWRFDFVKGYDGKWSREYVDASAPVMAFGEYWDTMSYKDGVLDYNQDAHRQRTINWCDSTGGTCAAFDFTTKGILQEAVSRMEYWRLVDPEGRPPGVMGMWPSRAVTFLENHDTGSTLQHWPFPTSRLQEGYAYLLTHPGTPCIFYDHYYDSGALGKAIRELIRVRKDCNLSARSKVFVRAARADVYAATIDDRVALKIGPGDWSPNGCPQSKTLGRWNLATSGHNYACWKLER